MKSMDTTLLIARYLDGLITPPEMAELNRRLASDPEAARSFHELARFDLLIQSVHEEHQAQELFAHAVEESKDINRSYTYTLRRIQPAWKYWLGRAWGPAGSVLLHAAVLLLLINYLFLGDPETGREGIEVELTTREELALDDLDLEIEAVSYLETEERLPEPEPPASAPQYVDLPTVAPGPVRVVSPAIQAPSVIFDAIYTFRGAKQRTARRKQWAGPWADDIAVAVGRSADWLKEAQLPHGAWPGRDKGMTGLALLSFLAQGQTPASTLYGGTVSRAIQYLKAAARDGYWGDPAKRGLGGDDHSVYEHAIVTYALAEALAMTRDESLRPLLNQAVKYMLEGQQAEGGWDYGYNPDASIRSDLSVSGWHIQALAAAHAAGIRLPQMAGAMQRAARFCRAMQNEQTGEFTYSNEGGGQYTAGMTGVAVWGLHLLDEGRSAAARRGATVLACATCDWSDPPPGGLYAWYYITHARFAGRIEWENWNRQMATAFIAHQQADGGWKEPGRAIGFDEGPVYSTTLATLTLSVYYRYALQEEILAQSPVDSGGYAWQPSDFYR